MGGGNFPLNESFDRSKRQVAKRPITDVRRKLNRVKDDMARLMENHPKQLIELAQSGNTLASKILRAKLQERLHMALNGDTKSARSIELLLDPKSKEIMPKEKVKRTPRSKGSMGGAKPKQ